MKKRRDNPRNASQYTAVPVWMGQKVTFARSLTKVLHYLRNPSTMRSDFKHAFYAVLALDRGTYPRYSTAER